MNIITDCFGTMVFDDTAMRKKLPKETYDAMRRTIKDGYRSRRVKAPQLDYGRKNNR